MTQLLPTANLEMIPQRPDPGVRRRRERPGATVTQHEGGGGHPGRFDAQDEQGTQARDREAAIVQVGRGVHAQHGLRPEGDERPGSDIRQAGGDDEVKKAAFRPGHDLTALEGFEGRDARAEGFEQILGPGARLGQGENVLNRLLEHVTLRVSFFLKPSGPMLP